MGEKQAKELPMAELKEAFILYDSDGSGKVSAIELGKILRFLGQNPSETEVQNIIREADTDGDGEIDYIEFSAMMMQEMNIIDPEAGIREGFKVFDKDGNGYISAEEMKQVLAMLGERRSDKQIDEMIREADIDGDGQINYEEYLKMVTST